MSESRSDEFLQPYREAVARHGAGFEATLWGSEEAQIRRFDVLIDLADLESCTVLDAGCGRGDFARRLIERDVPFARYVGIDAVPEMIELARRDDLPRCEFDVADFLVDPAALATGDPDYVCISGALNTMDDAAAQAVVRAAFDASAKGVIFNFLSDRPHGRWQGRDLTPARRFDTIGWIDWSLSLSSRVAFTQAYLDGHDATIMIRHDAGGSDG